MRIAVLGSSPIVLIAARYLTMVGHIVKVFEKSSKIGGSWIAPGLFRLKHRHANLIVAYDDNDLKALSVWKNFLLYEMNMRFEDVPNELININTKYHASFKPYFMDTFASEYVSIDHTHVECAAINDGSVHVNG